MMLSITKTSLPRTQDIKSKAKFFGQMKDGHPSGYCVIVNENFKYFLEYPDDSKNHSPIVLIQDSKNDCFIYLGDIANFKPNGFGLVTVRHNSSYFTIFSQKQQITDYMIINYDHKRKIHYLGQTSHQKRHGFGKYIYAHKYDAIGTWKDDKPHGFLFHTTANHKGEFALWKEGQKQYSIPLTDFTLSLMEKSVCLAETQDDGMSIFDEYWFKLFFSRDNKDNEDFFSKENDFIECYLVFKQKINVLLERLNVIQQKGNQLKSNGLEAIEKYEPISIYPPAELSI
jgi:hypothetical protein